MSFLDTQKYLRELESKIEEQTKSHVDLYLLNWLQDFVEDIYDQGRQETIEEEEDNIATANYKEGHSDGYTEGKEDGYDEGKQEGYEEGLEEGKLRGYDEGYDQGYKDGQNDCDNG